MKKLILALVALGFAFAISSCCDQSYCPGNSNCGDKNMRQSDDRNGRQSDDRYNRQSGRQDEPSYRWDTQGQEQQQQGQDRQHRRW